MLQVFLLFLCMALLGVALALPAILEAASPGPGILTFALLAAMVASFVWAGGGWWILLPVLALVALTLWLERDGPADAARPDGESAMSRRTRLRFRLWRLSLRALAALLLAFPILFWLDRAPAAFGIVVPGLVIALTAMTLFRFSFARACLRDEEMALPEAAAPAP